MQSADLAATAMTATPTQRLGYRQSRLCSLAYEHRWVTNADCKRKLLTGIRLHHRPSWFLRLNRLQTGLLGFVDPVSDSSNRLHETGKSRTGLGLVWQIDCALSNVRAFLNFWTVLKLLQRTVVYSERRLLRSFTEGATWWGQQLANSHCLNTVHKLFVEWSPAWCRMFLAHLVWICASVWYTAYHCAYVSDILLQGFLYVTHNWFCFYSKLLGKKRVSRLFGLLLYVEVTVFCFCQFLDSDVKYYFVLCGPPLGGHIMHYTRSNCLSIRLSICPVPTIKSEIENLTTFKRREVTSGVTERAILKSKVNGAEVRKLFLAHTFAKNVSIRIKPKTRMTPPHSMQHLLSNAVQQRKCILFEMTVRQSGSGDALQVNWHALADKPLCRCHLP